MDPLLEHLSRWKPFSAVVVGDFMLDQQLYGDAERLAADAPVPVLHIRRRTDNPGGAANVCLDLAAFKGRVTAIGVTGDDATGALLRESLESRGIGTSGLVAEAGRPTTVKQNLIGLAQSRHPQKMFRVDFESREPVSAGTTARLLEAFRGVLPQADIVCVEDYNKGVCTEELCQGVIRAARAAGKPVFVDPARVEDYAKYRGATVITPNRTEAETATGLATDGSEGAVASAQHNAALARALLESLKLDAVVLTLDRHGALLMEKGGDPVAVPTVARQVYDVTGAGDMFLAGLSAGRANGLTWADATRLANAAAGLEVEVFGVQPIPVERVHHALLEQSARLMGKVRTLEQIRVEAAARRSAGERIVFTNGCFDIIHSGHVTLLEQAAAQGDFLIIGLNDDASVRRLKGGMAGGARPVNGQDERARVLGAIEGVGAIVVFSEDTPMMLIEAVRPDVLVKGADYRKDQVVGGSFVESYGGRVALIELVEGKSTTGTIDRMRSARPG